MALSLKNQNHRDSCTEQRFFFKKNICKLDYVCSYQEKKKKKKHGSATTCLAENFIWPVKKFQLKSYLKLSEQSNSKTKDS